MCNVDQAFQWSKKGIPEMADEEQQGRHPRWQKMSVKVTHAIFGYVAAWSDTQAEEKKESLLDNSDTLHVGTFKEDVMKG